ncbi:MAG TPA: hypothetical protein VGK02_06990 [Candidatus Aquicultor sp.]|jgi:hypothetical protein
MSVEFAQLSVVQTAGMDAQLKATGYTAAKLFNDSKAQAKTTQDIPGIGDSAYWFGNLEQEPAGVHVLKGDVELNVSATLKDKQATLEAEKKLAAIVAGRLP